MKLGVKFQEVFGVGGVAAPALGMDGMTGA